MNHPHNARQASGTIPSTEFLTLLAPESLDDLLKLARPQAFSKGQSIFRVGERSRNVYILRTGRVKIFEYSALGREVILWFCLAGEIFGLAEIASRGERGVNAQACEDCETLVISEESFKSYLAAHPQAAILGMQALGSRLRVLGDMLVNLVSDDVNTRIAKLILRLSANYGTRVGKEIVLNIPLTHQEIADLVGTSRPTVTTALSELKRLGVLSAGSHRIRIESEELLNELVNR